MTAEAAPRARNEESNQPRRRRNEGADLAGETAKMTVPHGATDLSQFRYRWANDDGARISNLMQKDWDLVTIDGKVGATDDDKTVRHRVGTRQDGAPLYSYYMRQPLEFAEQDKRKKIAKVDADEKAILADADSREKPDNAYKPKV